MGGDPGDIQPPWPSSRAPSWASCGRRRPRRGSCGRRWRRRCTASDGIGRACRPARSPWIGRCHRCRSRQPPPPESGDRIREDYAEYFKAVVKACAIFRLAADSFPILRSDPQCEYRFPDCITPEFSQSFINNCLGNEFVKHYIETDYYRNWVNAIKSTFPQLKEATYNVSNLHYIDLFNIEEILDELDKLTLYEATSVLFTALFSEKVIAIHITGMLDSFSNSARPSSGLYLSDMSAYAEQLGGVNVPLAEICRLASLDTSHEYSPVSSFITSFSIASDFICVETDTLLDDNEVELGRKAAQELGRLWRQIKVGQCSMSELKETVLFKWIKLNV